MKRSYIHKAPRLFRRWRSENVGMGERWISLFAGIGFAALTMRPWKTRALGLLATGLLLRRALTGDSPLYRRFGLSSR